MTEFIEKNIVCRFRIIPYIIKSDYSSEIECYFNQITLYQRLEIDGTK